MNGLVYLAGPMTGYLPEEARNWRRYTAWELAKFKVRCLSPMRDTDLLAADQPIIAQGYESFMTCDRAVVARDLFDLRRCDVVLVNFLGASRVSFGTAWEMGAARMVDKPIVVCMEPSGNPNAHALCNQSGGYMVGSLDDGIACVKSLLAVG